MTKILIDEALVGFDVWWSNEGSQAPKPTDDMYEHCKRMCEIAWANGAYKALEQPAHCEALDKMADNARELGLSYEQPAQQEPVADNTYGYAKSLAEAIFKQHFASDEHYASGRIVWGVDDTVIGILTQIDNMVADMVRRTEQPAQEPDPDELTIAYMSGLYEGKKRKPWVGSTDEERRHLRKCNQQHDAFALALEALLKERNA